MSRGGGAHQMWGKPETQAAQCGLSPASGSLRHRRHRRPLHSPSKRFPKMESQSGRLYRPSAVPSYRHPWTS